MTLAAPASEALVVLSGVHGGDAQGPEGRALGTLRGVSVALVAGVHAFVGRPRDGTAALCELIAGRRRPALGAVTVAGRDPGRRAAARRLVGALLVESALAPAATVAAALEQIGAMRGAEMSQALAAIGAESLAGRSLRSLDRAEARSVELAAVLALPNTLALALFEPLAGVRADHARVRERIRAAADRGAAVIVATAAPEDLGALADHVHLLEGGRLWGRDHEVGWGDDPSRGLTLWVDSTGARELAASLAERSELSTVALDALPGSSSEGKDLSRISISGPDLHQAAIAVAETVAARAAHVVAMHSTAPSIDSMQQAARMHRAKLVAGTAPFGAPTGASR